jgi:hypothetical protein
VISKNNKIRVVEQTDLGLYVWQLLDGSYASDGQGNYMNIASLRGDLEKISRLVRAAKHYGFDDGQPVFLEGHRAITDEEYREQVDRMKEGHIPDPYDIGVYREHLDNEHYNRRH